ncbi:LLM class F420-dependent oxidoreductase [Dictyobacter aurantiacus]|uniref:LLM class F420-dependent oxidoreductase n=1 Tax=Dictyobacter aurantiacus TaxID=1936993 RepID=A0A401Z7Z7_9CHLR|nr:LLM class F420-dependent oxidoreductase [Dictyobacter aurantiacus]GCE02987.1 LLM class F420-dependent oxidoreductase [Dictyobacter aurantiacus]
MAHLSFGVKTAPQWTTYEDMLAIWQAADEEPLLEHAWLFDHFYPLTPDMSGPCLEGWSVLSAFAAVTKRIRLGLMVTGNTYRHPAVLANIAATVDVISKGRLDFGLGAGWNEYEHTAYGIPLYTVGERLRRLDEACEVIKRLWTEKQANFEGRYYQIKDAYCEPKPVQQPYPPFVIGGGGEKVTLRIAAKYASVWNMAGGSPEDFKRKNAILDEHCAAVGRNPEEIARSIQVPINPDNLAETRQNTENYIEAGVNHIVLNIRPPYPQGIVHRLVEEVVEPLKSLQM